MVIHVNRRTVMHGNTHISRRSQVHSEKIRTKYVRSKKNVDVSEFESIEFKTHVSFQNIKSIIKLLVDFPEENYPLFVISEDGTVSVTIEFYNQLGVAKFVLPSDFWTFGVQKIEKEIRFAVSLRDINTIESSSLYETIDKNGTVEVILSKNTLTLLDHDTSQRFVLNCKLGEYTNKVMIPLDADKIMGETNICKFVVPYEVFREELLFNIKYSKIDGNTVVIMFEPDGVVSFYYPFAPWFNQNLYYAYKTPPVWWGKVQTGYILSEFSLDLLIRSVKNRDGPEYTSIVLYLDEKENLLVTYTMDNIDYQFSIFSLSSAKRNLKN